MGNPQLVHSVLSSFRLSFMNDLCEMEISYLAGEYEKVAKIAHKIKGSAANVGAPTIYEIAKQLETAAKKENGELDELIGNLQSEFTKFAKAAFRECRGFETDGNESDSGETS